MRWGICALIVSGLSLATAHSQVYDMYTSTTRGSVTVRGTSLGAFTATPTYFAFQGTTTYGDFASTMAMPNLLANPVFDQRGQTVTISYANTEGLGDSGFNILIYKPDPVTNSGDPVLIDGAVTMNFTTGSGISRYTGGIATATDNVTLTGVYTAGSPSTGSNTFSLATRSIYGLYVYVYVARTTGDVTSPSSGASRLILNAGSTLTVGTTGTGTLYLSPDADNYGILQIGTGGASGTVLASEIQGGPGGSQVAFNQSDSITFTPRLTDNLSVLKSGPGTVLLTGANTYTAGTTISGGTLATANSQALGTGPLTATATSSLLVYNNLTLPSGNISVLGGTLSVTPGNSASSLTLPGGLTKLGPGMLKLLTPTAVNGNASVTAGTLSVDSLLQASNVIVAQQAALQGRGVILANVVNNGSVAPGNSPGTLTIQGNYTQSSSGTLSIEVASSTVYDQLVVHGTASLAGTLQFLSYGGYTLQPGDHITFLIADSVTGAFDSIVMPEGFRGRILQGSGEITLLIAPESYAQLIDLTQNERNVARALDAYISAPGGDRQTVSTALDALDIAQYPSALDQISPAFYETLGATTIQLATAQNQFLAQRLSAVRLGAARGFQATGVQPVLANDRNGKSVLDARDGKDIIQPAAETPWGVWVQGNGVFARTSSVNEVPSYHYSSGGFTTGADYAWGEHLSTGVFGGYQGVSTRYGGEGGSTTINQAVFGGYATAQVGGFYTDASISGGYSNYNVRRPIQFGSIDRTATSKPDGGQLTTYLDAGYDWHLGGFTLGPLVSGQYTYAGIAGFTESGADSLDLRVAQQNINSLQTNLGGRLAYTWTFANGIALIPEGRIFWQHEFLNNSRNIASTLDGGNGPSFDYETADPARDSVLASAGLTAQIGPRWNTNFYYTANFGSQTSIAHMISAALEWKF